MHPPHPLARRGGSAPSEQFGAGLARPNMSTPILACRSVIASVPPSTLSFAPIPAAAAAVSPAPHFQTGRVPFGRFSPRPSAAERFKRDASHLGPCPQRLASDPSASSASSVTTAFAAAPSPAPPSWGEGRGGEGGCGGGGGGGGSGATGGRRGDIFLARAGKPDPSGRASPTRAGETDRG